MCRLGGIRLSPQEPHAIGLLFIALAPAGLWRAEARAFLKYRTHGGDMAGHGAPGSPHAALLAGPFLGEPIMFDSGPLPGGIASGDVVHGRSVAPPGCVYRQPLCI
jgi:hypothetical protein